MPFGLFVKAHRSDAKALAKAFSKGQALDRAELPGMCLIDLATLKDVVMSSGDGVDLVCTAVRISHGAMVELPPTFIVALASMDEQQVSRTAVRWAQCEEFKGLCEPHQLEAFLRSLAALAGSAAKEQSPLLFLNL